ncbi:MAG: hypothetical protein J6L85_07605, partial [Clostridia bacterium]|nr:hypothetical protein [Clostridia bacterium]
FHSYHLIGGGYEETELDLDDAREYNFNSQSTDYVSTPGSDPRLEFIGIGKRVGTVRIDFEYLEGEVAGQKASYVDVNIDATDATYSADYRSNVATARAIRGNENSEYIILDLSGEVENLRFKFSTDKLDAFQSNP